MISSHARRVGTVVALGIVAGCRTGTAGAPLRQAPAPVVSSSDAAAIAKARADSARYPYTVADIHFMSAMIDHHAQAIEMARLALTRAADASVRTLAERIINGQKDEIATMQQWLRDRGQPAPEPHAHGAAMDHGAHGTHAMYAMPGMVSPEQMRQLVAAKGVEFDRLFLTFMIQHHRGAIEMVKTLFATPGAAQDQTVFKVASDANVDQTTEVDRMTRMLALILLR